MTYIDISYTEYHTKVYCTVNRYLPCLQQVTQTLQTLYTVRNTVQYMCNLYGIGLLRGYISKSVQSAEPLFVYCRIRYVYSTIKNYDNYKEKQQGWEARKRSQRFPPMLLSLKHRSRQCGGGWGCFIPTTASLCKVQAACRYIRTVLYDMKTRLICFRWRLRW